MRPLEGSYRMTNEVIVWKKVESNILIIFCAKLGDSSLIYVQIINDPMPWPFMIKFLVNKPPNSVINSK